jgi:hypothetical protein
VSDEFPEIPTPGYWSRDSHPALGWVRYSGSHTNSADGYARATDDYARAGNGHTYSINNYTDSSDGYGCANGNGRSPERPSAVEFRRVQPSGRRYVTGTRSPW